MTHHVWDITSNLLQSVTAQDMVFHGENVEDGTAYLVLGDGHGIGKVIESARKFNWKQIIDVPTANLQTIVQPFINKHSASDSEADGMTLTIVRIRTDYDSRGSTLIELAWIGDSLISIGKLGGVYDDPEDRLLFHNSDYVIHPSLSGRVTSEPVRSFQIKNENEVIAKQDYYFHFKNKKNRIEEVINMTGSIGHCGDATHHLFQKVIDLPKNDKCIIRIASDGWWNVMHKGDWDTVLNPNVTSKDLSVLAQERWEKLDWVYYPSLPEEDEVEPILNASLGESDDISVGTIVLYPKPDDVSYKPRRAK